MNDHELQARPSLTAVNISGRSEESRFRYQIKLEAINKGDGEAAWAGLTVHFPGLTSKNEFASREIEALGSGGESPRLYAPGDLIWGFSEDRSWRQKPSGCLMIESTLPNWKPGQPISLEIGITLDLPRLDVAIRAWVTWKDSRGNDILDGDPSRFDRAQRDPQGVPCHYRSVEAEDPATAESRFREYDNGFYLGQLRRGQRHGGGNYTWNDGRSYEGEWKEDNLHGEGVFTFADGGKFIGRFGDNCEVEGWRHYPDGSKKWVAREPQGLVENGQPSPRKSLTESDGGSTINSCPCCGAKGVPSGAPMCFACLKERGHAHARRGQWQEAAANFTLALASAPNDQRHGVLLGLLLATLLVERGDLEGYEKHRQTMLRYFEKPEFPFIAEQAAKACLITPISDPALVSAGRLADLAVVADWGDPGMPYFQFTKGLAEYRAGRFESAVLRQSKALVKMGIDERLDIQAHMVIAMAYCKLGRPDEARTAFEKGSQIAEAKLPKLAGGYIGDGWHDWIIAHALRREATLLVEQANLRAAQNARAATRKKIIDSDDPAALRALADEGNDGAAVKLGRLYNKGIGVNQNDAETIKWFRKAAESGNSDGQNSLGHMCRKGLGVKKDYAEAIKWFRKSAEAGNPDGQHNLGRMYRNGLGVRKDVTEAVKWYRKSAEAGNPDGQNWLGYMYQNGLGVEENYPEAIKWYRKAEAVGNAEAMKNMASLRSRFHLGI